MTSPDRCAHMPGGRMVTVLVSRCPAAEVVGVILAVDGLIRSLRRR